MYVDGDGVEQVMYIGDRWQSAPDRLKAHDFTVWAPVVFDAAGNATTGGFEDEFTLSVGA